MKRDAVAGGLMKLGLRPFVLAAIVGIATAPLPAAAGVAIPLTPALMQAATAAATAAAAMWAATLALGDSEVMICSATALVLGSRMPRSTWAHAQNVTGTLGEHFARSCERCHLTVCHLTVAT